MDTENPSSRERKEEWALEVVGKKKKKPVKPKKHDVKLFK